MSVKLLTEHHLEFLSLKGGYTGLSESIHVKIPHCWKSRVIVNISHRRACKTQTSLCICAVSPEPSLLLFHSVLMYGKTCLNQPLKKTRQNKGIKDK